MRGIPKLVVAAAITTFCLAGAATASAGQSTPGVPGNRNCEGQTTAYVTQGNSIPGVAARGIGHVADANNMTVSAVQAAIAAYCSVPT